MGWDTTYLANGTTAIMRELKDPQDGESNDQKAEQSTNHREWNDNVLTESGALQAI